MQILGKEELEELSSLIETIPMVRTEESRRGVMLEALPSEGSAICFHSDGEQKLSMDQKPNFRS